MNELIILQGAKACGKTTELVKLSAKQQIPIAVLDMNHINLYESIAKDLKVNIPKPILANQRSTSNKDILVDNIEDFFKLKLGLNLKGFTSERSIKVEEITRSIKK